MAMDQTGGAAFTMTEVVVAVVLMLLALGLLLSSFVSSKRSAALAQTHLVALQIADSEAERLKTIAYTNIVPVSAVLTNACTVYTISNSVVSVTNAFADKYKNIKVSVKWIAPASSRRQALTNCLTICNTN